VKFRSSTADRSRKKNGIEEVGVRASWGAAVLRPYTIAMTFNSDEF
jgi:hypothetical protein